MNDHLQSSVKDALSVISPFKFINSEEKTDKKLLVNISDKYDYSTIGYYVSLLGEARGLKVLPSSDDILALNNKNLFFHRMKKNGFRIDTIDDENKIEKINIIFGRTLSKGFKTVARKIYYAVSVPLLQVKINKEKNIIDSIKFIEVKDLTDDERLIFNQEIEKDEDMLLVRS